ncbi:CCR4-NOT transcription complex subunit 1-like isoform X1 [Olea europaea var. sylvestris]|uniref:CCR4-NOT transcription complex subunit 1-like isoform X1 n=1 Tax=Olea europaea var. sylvestris TaxID=158386 RepID=UPI000C1D4661|nr:CCR4-NOT transcription complex subunit 1-like isoform X1 [Olea europaea var. sylvestris]
MFRQYAAYGMEGSILVLHNCLDHLNIHGNLKNMQLHPVYASIFKHMLDKPNFSTVFCVSLKTAVINEEFLQNLSDALHLSAYEKIGVGLALSDSENLDIRMCGKKFCMGQIAELCTNPVAWDSTELIQHILVFLHRSEGLSKHVDSFVQMLSLLQLNEENQFILSPFLSSELREANFFRHLDLFNEDSEDDFDTILAEMEKEMSVADMMKELGYGCTMDVSQCKEMLSLFLPLNEFKIAKILGTIARTYAGLNDSQTAFTIFCSALGYNSVSDLPLLNSWNVHILVDSIKQLAPGINWINVMGCLDHEGFYIPNEASFSLFMSFYRHGCQDPFPLHAVCGSVWNNVEGQLSFLKYAVAVPPEVFTFSHSERQLAYDDAVNGHKFQSEDTNHAWLCLDLLEVLCQLAERGHASSVRAILKDPLDNCPKVLLLGMAHVNTAYNLLQYEVSSTVFPMVLRHALGDSVILHLWRVNPYMALQGFIDSMNSDLDNLTRVLDACQESKMLTPVLDMIPSYFGVRLAAVASSKELLDLEKWLGTHLSTYKEAFYEECLKFLKEVVVRAQEVSINRFHSRDSLVNVYLEACSTLLKVLQSHSGIISSSHLSEELEKLHATYLHATGRLKNDGVADSATSDGYADDIETQANSYFHQLFSGQLTIDAMIQKLARFKESAEKRQQSIFEFMIANLFEEYKFFSKFPETQLKIAAFLFGSLIKHQLVTHLTLGIALRAVLDALRKPADSKMFIFGTKALEQFVDRLVEWPQYCNHILQISHLRGTHTELVSFIERTLARISSAHAEPEVTHGATADQQHVIQASGTNMEMLGSSFSLNGPGGSSQTGLQVSSPVLLSQRQLNSLDERKASITLPNYMKPVSTTAGQSSTVPSSDSIQKSQILVNASSAQVSSGFARSSRATSARFGSALNIETLVAAADRRETPIEAPASEIQDKISFIINNLSAANFEAKAKELTDILKEQYYPWFAQYMVMKRASIEPNFHDLYLKFLDKVNMKPLNKEIVQTTYENCKVLLGSELIKSSSEERSLLKNLGSWLGKITIDKNQVLRAREIDPKSLIIEAYEKGLMIAVIPFTSKVLDSCSNSLAYQPPNPWTMGILGLLTEIYAMPNLKMNLKFDIEVLFKNLGVDLKDVTPTSLLKDTVREFEGNPDFSNKDIGASQPQMVNEVKSGTLSTQNQVELPLDVAIPPHPTSHSRVLSQYTTPLHLSSGMLLDDEKLALGLSDQLPSAQNLLHGQTQLSLNQLPVPASNIEQQVIVNPKLHALGLHLHFQSVLPIAMDRAIKEIVSSIVQRSVSIATQTTKEVVLKDYAMEPDEALIRNAAHLMVARLAGSLAHVTCKEPLRGSISSQLRSTLQGSSISSELLEAVQIVTNDNLDLGCALIEQAATEKAIQTIDGEIAQQLSIRRKHRESVGPTFFDASLCTQGHMSALPEALHPRPGRLSHSQQRVYEDFVRLPWQNRPTHNSNAVSVGPSISSGSSGMSRQFASVSGQINPDMYSSGLVNTGLGAVSQTLDIGSEEIDNSSAQHPSLPSTHIATADGLSPRSLENDTVASYPPVSAPELHIDPPISAKESGSGPQTPNPTLAFERVGSNVLEPLLTTGDALDQYQIISEKLENLLSVDNKEAEIQGVVAEVPAVILRCVSRDEAALAVAQKTFKGLYENASNNAHVNAHLAILAAIRDVSKLVVKELTTWVIYSDEDRKFNKDITIGLIHSELLNLAEYNVHMAKLLDAGRNKAATEFAISLIEILVVNDSEVISELHDLVDALAKLAARPGSTESLQQLVEIAKNPSGNSAALSDVIVGTEENIGSSRDKKAIGLSGAIREDYTSTELVDPDPAGFQEQVSVLFAEWYQICELPGTNDAACAHYILRLFQRGLLKGDDMSDRFFRRLMELSVSHCSSSEVINSGPSLLHQGQPLSFLAIDIFAKLVFSILKFSPDQGSSKLSLLPKVLAAAVKFIQKDAEEKRTSFNPRPYFRLFINWLLDLCFLDPVFDGANFQVLTVVANTFHALQPLKVPGFSFAWLELVSNRSFMPKLLTANAQKGWPYFQRLLVDLFQFMEPFLRNAELGEPVHFLYKGTLRVLLVLLHDFPEFLCDYHFSFCDVIPPSCIQMRNIILSAFPRNMRLPDPSTPNLKIDLLTEISQSPRILAEVDASLKAKQMKNDVDEYLKTRQQGSTFLADLKQKLLRTPSDAAHGGTHYNVPLINSLVLHVGMQAIQQLQARAPPHSQSMASMTVFLVSAALDIFKTLIMDLDTEGCYLFLNAVANQLRYPNNHTHYFSFILLHLFAESNQEMIQEQITRVLLERLIVNRPHPWGLLITFIELIKNPRYNFWNRSFTRCAPEIEKLFESVSRSCGGPKPVDDGVGSGGIPDNMH